MNVWKSSVAMLLVATGLNAQAATPESGTLSLESSTIEFGSGPNIGVNPTPLSGSPLCQDLALPCDHFDLTVDLPETIGDVFPSSQIKMTFSWDDVTGQAVDDYDIYMYDADGNLLASAATGNNPEFIGMIALGGVREYRFDIVYFSVIASTYTGKIELVLGEPAEDADVDAFFEENSVLGRYLNADSSSDEQSDNAYVERRKASGALNLFVLCLSAIALWRRRRAV